MNREILRTFTTTKNLGKFLYRVASYCGEPIDTTPFKQLNMFGKSGVLINWPIDCKKIKYKDTKNLVDLRRINYEKDPTTTSR